MFKKEPSEVSGLSKSSPDGKRALNPYNKTWEQAALRTKIKIAFSLFSHYKFIFICLEYNLQCTTGSFRALATWGYLERKGRLLYPQSHE